MDSMKMIEVTPTNVLTETLFCIKDIKKPGFNSKQKWFEKRYKEGLRMKILKDGFNKMIGFIEYIPALKAWRPIDADNYMFIHCMTVYSKNNRNKGYGSMLVKEGIDEAKKRNMDGICTMTSKGSWIANKSLFEKNGFEQIEKKERFELLSLTWNLKATAPKFIDWSESRKEYKGWHLVYADQCPWHESSVVALSNVAMDFDIELKVTKLTSVKEAKKAPSGYGVFNLLHNGKLLEDHYLSATRFKNILNKELSKT